MIYSITEVRKFYANTPFFKQETLASSDSGTYGESCTPISLGFLEQLQFKPIIPSVSVTIKSL